MFLNGYNTLPHYSHLLARKLPRHLSLSDYDTIAHHSLFQLLRDRLQREAVDFEIFILEESWVVQMKDDENAPFALARIALTRDEQSRLRHESQILNHLASERISTFALPQVLYHDTWQHVYVQVRAFHEAVYDAPIRLDARHLAAVHSLAGVHRRDMPLEWSGFWRKLQIQRDQITNQHHRRLITMGMWRARKLLNNQPLIFHMSNGNFAPSQMSLIDQQLLLCNWEDAYLEAPVGHDIVHFIIETRREHCGDTPAQVLTQFASERTRASLSYHLQSLGVQQTITEPLLLLYLADRLAAQATETTTPVKDMTYTASLLHGVLMHYQTIIA